MAKSQIGPSDVAAQAPSISLHLKRGQAGGVKVVDAEVRSGPLEGQRVRIIPTDPSSAYFYQEAGKKTER